MKKTKIALAVVLLVIMMGLVYEISIFYLFDMNPDAHKIDSCMDNGGCWDYVDNICRKDEVNAQELCHRKK